VRSRRIPILVLLVLVLCANADAQVPAGTAQLAGSAKLAARGCGADREPNFSSTVTLLADGSWTAADPEGVLFGGSWVTVGSSGRKVDLYFDAATEADLIATVTADLGLLCDAPDVVVTSAVRRRFTLTLNRAGTKAKLVLRYVFKGRANNRSGSAGYRIRAKGPFAPAA
jgi:hypothetical protein